MKKIIILQRLPKDQERILKAFGKICPELLMEVLIDNDINKEVKEQIKAERANIFKKKKKPMLVVTGSILLTIGGKRIVKKIKRLNPTADIILYSRESIESKKIMHFIKKELTDENAEELAKYVKEYVKTGKRTQ